jgi:hypothetical protein
MRTILLFSILLGMTGCGPTRLQAWEWRTCALACHESEGPLELQFDAYGGISRCRCNNGHSISGREFERTKQ